MNDPDPFMLFEEPSLTAIGVPVLKVFDGDGFLTRIAHCHLTNNPKHHIEVEVTVRFGFIDAPELEQRGGCEAREFLTALIGERTVWIDILTKMDTGKSVDQYGRVVAVPYLVDRYTASMFNNRSVYLARNIELAMLLNGWAWVIEKYGPDEIYFEALEVARRNKRGIWAHEDNVPPWTFKRQKYVDRRSPARPVEKRAVEGCAGRLVKRNGRFGAFYGCSNYPNCRYTRST
jgi:endonuclease YncB( thermonuclease family)